MTASPTSDRQRSILRARLRTVGRVALTALAFVVLGVAISSLTFRASLRNFRAAAGGRVRIKVGVDPDSVAARQLESAAHGLDLCLSAQCETPFRWREGCHEALRTQLWAQLRQTSEPVQAFSPDVARILVDSEESIREVTEILLSGRVRWGTSYGSYLAGSTILPRNLVMLHDILLADSLTKARSGDFNGSAEALEAAASLRHAMSRHLETLVALSELTRHHARAVRKPGMPPDTYLEEPAELWGEFMGLSERRVLALSELALATARRPSLLGVYLRETPWGSWIRGGSYMPLRIPVRETGRWYLKLCLADHVRELTRLLGHERSVWQCGRMRTTRQDHEPRQAVWNRVEDTIAYASPEPVAWHLRDTVLEVELTRLVREAREQREGPLRRRVDSRVCADWAWRVEVRPGMEPRVTFVGALNALPLENPPLVSHPPEGS